MIRRSSPVLVSLAFVLAGCGSAAGGADLSPRAEGRTATSAAALTFETDPSKILLAGTGCSAQTAFVSQSGGRFDIDFVALGVALDPSGSPTAGRVNCVVRIPVTLPPGYYVSRVDQNADYDVTTTTGGNAAIASVASITGAGVGGLNSSFGGDTSAQGTLHRSSAFEQDGTCSDQPRSGFISINLAVSGQKAAQYDLVRANITHYSLDANQDIVLSQCAGGGAITPAGGAGSAGTSLAPVY